MKTKDLIKLLQEADPNGEFECCIGNADILAIDVRPAWYDGPLQILKRDSNKNGYNIIGVKITNQGTKIVLLEHSIGDVLLDFSDIPVEFDANIEEGHWYKNYIESLRQIYKE